MERKNPHMSQLAGRVTVTDATGLTHANARRGPTCYPPCPANKTLTAEPLPCQRDSKEQQQRTGSREARDPLPLPTPAS